MMLSLARLVGKPKRQPKVLRACRKCGKPVPQHQFTRINGRLFHVDCAK